MLCKGICTGRHPLSACHGQAGRWARACERGLCGKMERRLMVADYVHAAAQPPQLWVKDSTGRQPPEQALALCILQKLCKPANLIAFVCRTQCLRAPQLQLQPPSRQAHSRQCASSAAASARQAAPQASTRGPRSSALARHMHDDAAPATQALP